MGIWAQSSQQQTDFLEKIVISMLQFWRSSGEVTVTASLILKACFYWRFVGHDDQHHQNTSNDKELRLKLRSINMNRKIFIVFKIRKLIITSQQ